MMQHSSSKIPNLGQKGGVRGLNLYLDPPMLPIRMAPSLALVWAPPNLPVDFPRAYAYLEPEAAKVFERWHGGVPVLLLTVSAG